MAMQLGRGMLTPLVIIIFWMTCVELAISAWGINRHFNAEVLFGNPATLFLLFMALISGVVGAASLFATLHHLRLWRQDSLAAAAATALIDLMLSLLALGFASKEIQMGGRDRRLVRVDELILLVEDERDRRLRVLEAFVIILAGLKLFKVVTLHTGLFLTNYDEEGGAYTSTGGRA